MRVAVVAVGRLGVGYTGDDGECVCVCVCVCSLWLTTLVVFVVVLAGQWQRRWR